jgi:hypothetical protein
MRFKTVLTYSASSLPARMGISLAGMRDALFAALKPRLRTNFAGSFRAASWSGLCCLTYHTCGAGANASTRHSPSPEFWIDRRPLGSWREFKNIFCRKAPDGKEMAVLQLTSFPVFPGSWVKTYRTGGAMKWELHKATEEFSEYHESEIGLVEHFPLQGWDAWVYLPSEIRAESVVKHKSESVTHRQLRRERRWREAIRNTCC